MDDAESIRAIRCALEAGINFFDTAANYGCGHSERLLGQAIAGRRDRVVLATKFGYVVNEETRMVTGSTDIVGRIHQECEASLRRLQTDYIDLYQFHVKDYDPENAAEIRDALESLVNEGKICWYGWSTDNPAGARLFAQGQHCTAIQHTLSMAIYRPKILAVCEEHDLASINRYPLASGLLTGKLNLDSTFPEDDYRHGWNMREGLTPEWLQCLEAVREAFAGDARTLAQVALGWIWARSERTIPIPGFRTVAQVQENVNAMEFGPLSSDQMKQIDEIFARSRIST